VTDHTALIMIVAALATLIAIQVALAAGYLAHRDQATTPQSITRAATAFAATLTLIALLTTALQALLH
jgi:uncharacterized membrane protein